MGIKYYFLLLLWLPFSTSVYGASDHLLKHIEGLSRDFYYIDFSRDSANYKHQTLVGGEHEIHYFLLGFENDTFIISIHSEDGDVGYVPPSYSHKIVDKHWDEQKQLKVIVVNVIEQQAWVKVSFSAHPVARYSIEVKRLVVLEH